MMILVSPASPDVLHFRYRIITILLCNCGRPGAMDSRSGDPLGSVGDEGVQHRGDWGGRHPHPRSATVRLQPRRVSPESAQWRDPVEPPGAAAQVWVSDLSMCVHVWVLREYCNMFLVSNKQFLLYKMQMCLWWHFISYVMCLSYLMQMFWQVKSKDRKLQSLLTSVCISIVTFLLYMQWPLINLSYQGWR